MNNLVLREEVTITTAVDTKSNRLCIATYVFGEYTRFIPFYIYTILKSYQDYHVKIFVYGFLSKREKACLNLVRSIYGNRFEIVENYCNDLSPSDSQLLGNDKTTFKTLRWLIPYREFKDYNYAYIGDIDYLIIREEPSLLQGHLEHCAKTGLPYSNTIRKHSKRLTGLHFFKVREYYQKMNSIIDHYLGNIDELLDLVKKFKSSPNEEFLYFIVARKIGVIEQIKYKNELHYRPEHGFHLGNIRSGTLRRSNYLKRYQNNRNLLAYCHDKTIYEMLHIMPVKEIIYLFKHLIKKPNLSFKIQCNVLCWNMIKKIKSNLAQK